MIGILERIADKPVPMLVSDGKLPDLPKQKAVKETPKMDLIKAWLSKHPESDEISNRKIAEMISDETSIKVSYVLVGQARKVS